MKKVWWITLIALFIDQAVKLWVKTSFTLAESVEVIPGFFELNFVENPGAAFGVEIFGGNEYGKLALSLFRIGAVIAIGFYIKSLIKNKAHKLFVFCMTMVFAGAIGNIIDSLFYGWMFTTSYFDSLAQFASLGEGYASDKLLGGVLFGKVVDMFHFTPRWPQGTPFGFGGSEIFGAIFNVADSYISLGVIIIIAKYKSFFEEK